MAMALDKLVARRALKRGLALARARRAAPGTTVLIYHRVGGGSHDELDLDAGRFAEQVQELGAHRVVGLDQALDELDAGDDTPKVVLTFDDGFADVYAHAWPVLRAAAMPFTVYLASAYMGAPMRWEGSTGSGSGNGLTWEQLEELARSGLMTIGNHTHHHVPPDQLTENELDACSNRIEDRLGVRPHHFTYPWGTPVAAAEPWLRARFRSATTGTLGRNHPGDDPMRLKRVPVRNSDPIEFFAAKLTGSLGPERVYAGAVAGAKQLRAVRR